MREQTINKYLLALNGAYSGISNSPFTVNIITNEQVTKGYIVPIFKVANWPNISSVNVHAMVEAVNNFAKNLENELISKGFDVLVFIPSPEEEEGLITCGNLILSRGKEQQ